MQTREKISVSMDFLFDKKKGKRYNKGQETNYSVPGSDTVETISESPAHHDAPYHRKPTVRQTEILLHFKEGTEWTLAVVPAIPSEVAKTGCPGWYSPFRSFATTNKGGSTPWQNALKS